MLGIIVCIAAGAAMSFQGVMNTRLGESIGTSEANAFAVSYTHLTLPTIRLV